MAKISARHVQYLGQLARIHLAGKQLDEFAGEVASILGFVEQLQQADVKDLPATSQVTGLTNVWRDDEIKPCNISSQELLKNAPATEDGYLKVKRILE